LDGRRRHGDDVLQSRHQKPRIDELIREQRIFCIIELRADFDGAGGGVDLIIDG